MNEVNHYSVLLNEAIAGLNIKENEIYIDCTFGGGGHSLEILKRLDKGELISIDQDEYAIERGRHVLESTGKSNFRIVKDNFANIKDICKREGISEVSGILYDLGVSSFQFDMAERGFSYRLDAPLDMRMDQSSSLSAYTIVNTYPEDKLAEIFFKYGEIKESFLIARKICAERRIHPINTTLELVDVIKKSLPAYVLRKNAHPAKKVFQALRIEVNNELGVLEDSLDAAFELLKVGGRIVVISFHSLEDRIVKNKFREKVEMNKQKLNIPIKAIEEESNYRLINKNVILPSLEELEENNRSHSAKMRIIERIK